MRILVFSPHPDDAIMGCGGTMLNHLDNKDTIEVVVFSRAISGDEDMKIFSKEGIKSSTIDHDFEKFDHHLISKVMNKIREFMPDIVLTHIPEGHIDHIKGSIATVRGSELAGNGEIKSAFPPFSVEKIYFFETVDGTLSNGSITNSIVFIDIAGNSKKKMSMLHKFKSLTGNFSEVPDLTESLAKLRGFQSSSTDAEAFLCYPVLQKAEQLRGPLKKDSNVLVTDFEKICSRLLFK